VLTVIEKILFLVLAGVCSYYAYTGFKRIVDAVKRGEKGYYPRLNELPKRITDAVVKTLSQTTVLG
jgi:hypothetical protein